jgi:hypothetical protein
MEEKKSPDWTVIEVEYLAGTDTLRLIAERQGVTEGAIRARAKKYGWTRYPSKMKRAIVEARMSGITQDITQDVMRKIEEAAALDVQDMERGLRICRLCLINLEQSANGASDPREIKIIIDATAAAVDSIRGIRGLDSSSQPPQVLPREKGMTDEELDAELKKYGIEKP